MGPIECLVLIVIVFAVAAYLNRNQSGPQRQKYHVTPTGPMTAEEDLASLKWVIENWEPESLTLYSIELSNIWSSRMETNPNSPLRAMLYRVGDYRLAIHNISPDK